MFRQVIRRVLATNPTATKINVQPNRTTIIMRRMYPHNPPNPEEPPKKRERGQQYVYCMVENTTHRKIPDIDVILAMDIEELGLRGDLVTVKRTLAWNHLLPSGAAVYASPENKQKYEPIQKANSERPRQSLEGQRTLRALNAMTLPVLMNPDSKWELNRKHLRVAFRRVGVELDEQCISLPSTPVTEPGDIEFKVKVNDVDTVTVKGKVLHYSPGDPLDIQVFQNTERKIEDIITETVMRHRQKSGRL